MLKKCVVSLFIVFISLLPVLSMVFINNKTTESGASYLMLMFSMISLLAGLFIAWFYYLFNLVKSSKNIEKSMFNEEIKNV
jgi:uncharacterized membrane protein